MPHSHTSGRQHCSAKQSLSYWSLMNCCNYEMQMKSLLLLGWGVFCELSDDDDDDDEQYLTYSQVNNEARALSICSCCNRCTIYGLSVRKSPEPLSAHGLRLFWCIRKQRRRQDYEPKDDDGTTATDEMIGCGGPAAAERLAASALRVVVTA